MEIIKFMQIIKKLKKYLNISCKYDELTLYVVESIHGNWNYHLSETGKSGSTCLCGCNKVMCCNSPIETYNMEPTHINYKFCLDCYNIAIKRGFEIPNIKQKTLTFKSKG
jgi:hypothetical protein